MKAYVINLERSIERKAYMQQILKHMPFLAAEFVSAVDGKAMNDGERMARFDVKRFKCRYDVDVRPGEIGCTLSHQKCYRKIIENNERYALILEDDILLPKVKIGSLLEKAGKMMDTDMPLVLLLSGRYWYLGTSQFADCYKIANVYNAFLTHAYLINRAAAKILIEKRPYITADDWLYIRNKGVKIQAILPHLIDQNIENIVSTIQPENIPPKSLKNKLRFLGVRIFMKLLRIIGHFEKV